MDERVLKSFKRSDVPRELLGGADLKKLYQYTAIDLGIIHLVKVLSLSHFGLQDHT